jgi:hypothetical protein
MSVRLAAAYRPLPCTVPLSSITLTPTEESGDLARAVGMRPDRHHQAPAHEMIPPWSVRFVHPPYVRGVPARTGANPSVHAADLTRPRQIQHIGASRPWTHEPPSAA